MGTTCGGRQHAEGGLYVMELLKEVSMGIDILPSTFKVEEDGGGGEGGVVATKVSNSVKWWLLILA